MADPAIVLRQARTRHPFTAADSERLFPQFQERAFKQAGLFYGPGEVVAHALLLPTA